MQRPARLGPATEELGILAPTCTGETHAERHRGTPDRIAKALLIGAGAPEIEAATVARLSIAANLAGHDSHGIIMIPSYIDRMKVGHIVPGAPWEIKQETPTTTVIDGNWGFGYVVTERAMQHTIAKARTQNVAAAPCSARAISGALPAIR